jgi:tRNA(Ile)-lysidine synthase
LHLGYNSGRMIDKLQSVLESLCSLDINQPVLAGVSGGADSLCLMDILAQAGFRLSVAHLNHGLRPEADSEAERVRKYARKLGVEFIGERVDVPAFMRSEHLSLEEAARIVRYRFLFSTATQIGAQAVAVGHTADDQVETILMHLLRGAALAGLRGMQYRTIPTAWSNEIPIVRPLLGTWRVEILGYVVSRGYAPVFDASNQDVKYFRNRVRNELIPALESYNPRLRRNLWQMGEILRDDYQFIQEHVQAAWKVCNLKSGDHYLEFARARMLEQPVSIQRYLFKMAIEELQPGFRDLDSLTLERACRFLTSPTHSRNIELTNGLVLSQRDDVLIISAGGINSASMETPEVQPGVNLVLEVPGTLRLPGEWVLKSTLISNSRELLAQIQANLDPFQAWIDADMLVPPLSVRARLPGDRFKPFGMKGHSMKLSDLMVNIKLSQKARSGYPLVCGICKVDGSEEIIWVPGFRQSEICRVRPETQRIVWLLMERINKAD